MADGGGTVDLKQDRAHSARIYDYFLGGKDNYDADRAAAAQIERRFPMSGWWPGRTVRS
jgi:hypothetical protein